jgi:hypothetical protein
MLTLLPDDLRAAQKIVDLTNQVAVLSRALTRTLDERNAWRENFLSLSARMERLGRLQAEVIELRGEAS